MTKLEHAIKHIKTRADAWAVKEVTEALQSISERMDKALSVNPQPSEHFIDGVHAVGYREGYKDAQKQKSGKWKVVSDGYGDSAYICECSECKDTVWVYKNADRKWNYCPNCGAKMESEE